MRKFLVSILLSTTMSAPAVNGAHAKEVKLSGLYTQDQVRAACRAVGGVSWTTGGRYGCSNDAKGTQVSCDPGGNCTGEVPDRPARINPGTATLMGVIAGPAKPVKAAVPAGGILDGPGGFTAQGPAATGAPAGGARPPVAPPASGPIIR